MGYYREQVERCIVRMLLFTCLLASVFSTGCFPRVIACDFPPPPFPAEATPTEFVDGSGERPADWLIGVLPGWPDVAGQSPRRVLTVFATQNESNAIIEDVDAPRISRALVHEIGQLTTSSDNLLVVDRTHELFDPTIALVEGSQADDVSAVAKVGGDDASKGYYLITNVADLKRSSRRSGEMSFTLRCQIIRNPHGVIHASKDFFCHLRNVLSTDPQLKVLKTWKWVTVPWAKKNNTPFHPGITGLSHENPDR